MLAARRASDRYFCWEEPGRGAFAIAALGAVSELVSRGPARLSDLRRDAAALLGGRMADEPHTLASGAGPLLTGGLAFAPDGGSQPQWSSLPPALLVLAEVSIARGPQGAWITASAMGGGGTSPQAVREALAARLAALEAAAAAVLPPLDPSPTAGTVVGGARPPADYERAVAAAVERIRAGLVDKLVLAREVTVDAPAAHSVDALFGALRQLFDSCFVFCVGTPEAAFVGASPELLVRRDGGSAATVALAGSARRSADPSVDAHLGEQLMQSAKDRSEHAIVARRIKRRLEPLAVWVEVAPEPVVVQVANIQHLATPIRAQLAESRSVLELAGVLHPTPAVGTEPATPEAEAMIGELEGMDRGWYAGPVGWMDASEDGEFCVALRSALLRDRRAHLFAGAGIVADSDPPAELAETEIKLGALLPLLAG